MTHKGSRNLKRPHMTRSDATTVARGERPAAQCAHACSRPHFCSTSVCSASCSRRWCSASCTGLWCSALPVPLRRQFLSRQWCSHQPLSQWRHPSRQMAQHTLSWSTLTAARTAQTYSRALIRGCRFRLMRCQDVPPCTALDLRRAVLTVTGIRFLNAFGCFPGGAAACVHALHLSSCLTTCSL